MKENWLRIPIAIKGVGCWLLIPSQYSGIRQMPSNEERLRFKLRDLEFKVSLPPEIVNANPEQLAGNFFYLIPDGEGGFVIEIHHS